MEDALSEAGAFVGVGTPFVEPGYPWEYGNVEPFSGRLRDELLKGEIFDTLVSIS